MKRRILLVFLIGLMSLSPLAVLADDDSSQSSDNPAPAFGIRAVGSDGTHFVLAMNPGEQRELTIGLSNTGDAYGFADTFAADVFPLINGGFAVREMGEPISGETLWLDYEPARIELAPGMEIHQSFTVSVPEDALPGKYITAVVIQGTEPVKLTGGEGFVLQQITRHPVAVIVTVPGPSEPGLSIGEGSHRFRSGTSVIRVAVENAGNVWLRPHGEFWLETSDGVEIDRRDVEMRVIYSWRGTSLEIVLDASLDPGDYVAGLRLADPDEGVEARAEGIRIHVPEPPASEEESIIGAIVNDPRMPGDGGVLTWLYIIMALVVVAGLGVLTGALMRRGATSRREIASERVQALVSQPRVLLPVIEPTTAAVEPPAPLKPARAGGRRALKPLVPRSVADSTGPITLGD